MTYKQTLDFLFSQLPAFHRIGKAAYKNNLDNSLALDEYFDHPHQNFRTIHIAGTNGKGSVSHMLASVLQESGYRTGLYTSPHLRDFRERIRVNGEMISKKEVIMFVAKHRKVIDSIKPSFFEMCVALAFDYFARMKVEIAVIETGLGGRLDSTNIITPIVSVITNIGHDHFDLLGDTLEKVAIEKAGIIKPKVPVVIGETMEETSAVFIKKAESEESSITFADSHLSCESGTWSGIDQERRYIVRSKSGDIVEEGTIPLPGDYQTKNLLTLFQTITIVKDILNIGNKAIVDGIANVVVNTGLAGRWQVLAHHPLTICDTGHNKEGIESVIDQIRKIRKDKLHIIIGFVSDKDLDQILPLFPPDADYYFTKASVQRAMDEVMLKEKAGVYGLKGRCYPSVKKALNSARRKAGSGDLIFIGGSTFVVAEVV